MRKSRPLRLTPELDARVEAAATDAALSVNEYVCRVLEAFERGETSILRGDGKAPAAVVPMVKPKVVSAKCLARVPKGAYCRRCGKIHTS